jgi:hypothetical protein
MLDHCGEWLLLLAFFLVSGPNCQKKVKDISHARGVYVFQIA